MKGQTEQDYKQRILRVLVHIQEHLDEAVSLDELGAVAHFSPYHFHRIFRGMIGESVMQHIRRLRLERAAHRLKFGDLSVTRVAFEAGYETIESFTRAFSAMFGAPPSQFRTKHRTLPFPPVPSGIHFDPDVRLEACQTMQPHAPLLSVHLEHIPATRLAFMRHIGPYADAGRTWGALFSWAGPRGLLGKEMKIIGILHDDPEITPADKIRYDAGIVVNEDFQPESDVGVQEIRGEYAITTHLGPYAALGETYARLCGEWLPTSGRELLSAPGFEIYRNSPQNTPPKELLTDIHLPLAPR